MKTYLLNQIRESVDLETQGLQIEEKYVYVFSLKKPHKLLKLFQQAGHRYVEIDLQETVKFLASKLAKHIDIEEFLKELILGHSHPDEILELKERLEKQYTKVESKNRCYSLMIGGKRGRPYEFTLIL